jgi:hypothetical protein
VVYKVVAASFWVMTKEEESGWWVVFFFKPVLFFFYFFVFVCVSCYAPWRTSTRHTARPPELQVATNRLLLFLAALQADAPPTLLLQPPLSCLLLLLLLSFFFFLYLHKISIAFLVSFFNRMLLSLAISGVIQFNSSFFLIISFE